MTYTLETLAARAEIEDLLSAYPNAIDRRQWDELDDVFTPDAIIDYSQMGGGGIRGDLQTIKNFLAEVFKPGAGLIGSQHMVATSVLSIDGDHATGRSICFNPMVTGPEGQEDDFVYFVGLWYVDRFVRTPAGWRISDRRLERCFKYNKTAAQNAGHAAHGV
jgi:hypothetical protein